MTSKFTSEPNSSKNYLLDAISFQAKHDLPYVAWTMGEKTMRIDTANGISHERPASCWLVSWNDTGVIGDVVVDKADDKEATLYRFRCDRDGQNPRVMQFSYTFPDKQKMKDYVEDGTVSGYLNRFEELLKTAPAGPENSVVPLGAVAPGTKGYDEGNQWNLALTGITGFQGSGSVASNLNQPFVDAGLPNFRDILVNLRARGRNF